MKLQKLTFAQGEDFVAEFTPDADLGGVDIGAWTLEMPFRREDRADDVAADFTFTTGGGGITIVHPKIRVAITTDQTRLFSETYRYFWEVWRTNTGSRTVIAKGTLTVTRTIKVYP